MCSLTDAVEEAHAGFGAARARLVRAVADLAASEVWWRDGAVDVASWLCRHLQISMRSARELVNDAETLGDRPVLVSALADGSATVDQCRAMAVLGEASSDDLALANLPFWSLSELEREARKEKARTLEVRDGGTWLRMRPTRDERYLKGEFQVDAADGAALIAAIDARIPANTLPQDLDRASAVALVDLALGSDPVREQRPVVLLSGDVAELSTGGVVGAEAARRLACDATMHGKPIPAATRRAVEARDGYRCTFPDCERDLYLQCHHIVHRIDGGTNEVSNLQLVCWQHHKLIHEGGWTIAGEAGPRCTWVRPDGTTLEPTVRGPSEPP
jgi:hypothetical protein